METGWGPLRRALRQPLLHFLLIGVAVFTLYRAGGPSEPVGTRNVITVTPAQVGRLAEQFEAVWRRPPTEAEQAGLVDDFVREEIYYREALALGLDRDDTVIRRRLRQKMEFMSDAGAGALVPVEAELRAFFDSQIDLFTPAARITFRQVFLGDADAAPVLAALTAGADPGSLGIGTLLPPLMEAATAASVDGTFGEGFFAAVSALGPGPWRGPVESAFGAHLVQLVDIEPAVAPSFEAVRGEVEEAWRRQAADALREAEYQALRERYEVVMPSAER
jgi:hypothetical protein